MVNKAKIKGDTFERELVDYLNEHTDGNFKRVPGSGAMGTALGESLLTSDVVGTIKGVVKKLRFECKARSVDSSFGLKKEWLDKIREESENSFSLPFLAGKFIGSRSGMKKFIVMDLDVFVFFNNPFYCTYYIRRK
jgi:Holliday junction resolvase